MSEQAVLFGQTAPMVGVLTDPSEGTKRQDAAVVLLNAGIVHRVGPSGLYVKLARRLAGLGYVVVRFDGSGIGDSEVRRDHLPFEKSAVLETIEVMDYVTRARGVHKFVLVGICSGAVTAFKTACEDRRVTGAALLNAQGFHQSGRWNAYAMNPGWVREYWRNLRSVRSWRNALTGRTQYRRLIGVMLGQIKIIVSRDKAVSAVATSLASQLAGVVERNIRLLFMFSKGDHSANYLNLMMGGQKKSFRASGLITEETIIGADHTFTRMAHQQRVIDTVEGWLVRTRPEGVGVRGKESLGRRQEIAK